MYLLSAFCLVLPTLVAALPLVGRGPFNGFVKGVNWPWGSGGAYGHWLSAEAGTGYAADYVTGDTTLAMQSSKAIGVQWMRVWLFEAGQGLQVDGNGIITGVNADFWTNFDDIVNQVGANDIQLYPTLFTSAPGMPGTDMTEFANWFIDADAQNALLNIVIIPFAQHYKGNSAIAAIQLYNEMNGFTNSYWQGTAPTTYVSNVDAKACISAVVQAIKGVDPNYLVSTSQMLLSDQYHPANGNNGDYIGTGLDFYDIHVYSDDGSDLLPVSDLGLDGPFILGEFGEITAQGDAHQATVLQNFLTAAKNGGWSGALYWTLGSQGPDAASNPGDTCPDADLLYSLFSCEGQPRQSYIVFQQFS